MHVLHEFGSVPDGSRLRNYPDILPIPAGDRLKSQPVLGAEDISDLLYGMSAIAGRLGLKVPQARHLSDKCTVPTFKVGKMTCVRRSDLNNRLAESETSSMTDLRQIY